MNNQIDQDQTTSTLKTRARALGLAGVLAHWNIVAQAPWLPELLAYEEQERARRSLLRRTKAARLGRFAPMSAFQWTWPKVIDHARIESLFSLTWIEEAGNIILFGPQGLGKTMIAKNLAATAIEHGYSALFITASELLHDLASQHTPSALTTRLRHYARPHVLVIDELGYLSSRLEHADLLFELVNRRYEQKPIILTSNKHFAEWPAVFGNATSVTAIVDRLIHRADMLRIEGDSYRLKEGTERNKRTITKK